MEDMAKKIIPNIFQCHMTEVSIGYQRSHVTVQDISIGSQKCHMTKNADIIGSHKCWVIENTDSIVLWKSEG